MMVSNKAFDKITVLKTVTLAVWKKAILYYYVIKGGEQNESVINGYRQSGKTHLTISIEKRRHDSETHC
ncbi:hypothetical protein BTH160X_50317 [Brochothrix thermosphacta]|nr:hypothetical protein BTH160X_50317 [Brochothrix thermosphacta]